jgi:hypothetical protein
MKSLILRLPRKWFRPIASDIEKILAEFRTQGTGAGGVCVRGLACLGWYQ